MFDEVIIWPDMIEKYDIRCASCNKGLTRLQTKDFECELSHYEFSSDMLFKDESLSHVDGNVLHGYFFFYESCDDCRCKDDNLDKAWNEFKLKFTDGICVSVERVKDK